MVEDGFLAILAPESEVCDAVKCMGTKWSMQIVVLVGQTRCLSLYCSENVEKGGEYLKIGIWRDLDDQVI